MNYIEDIHSTDGQGFFTGYMSRIITAPGDTWQNIWVHCWDAVWGGTFVKLATLFPENEQYDYFARWNIEFWSNGMVPHEDPGDSSYVNYTPGGYGMLNTWGSARYNCAAQLCGLIYGKHRNRTDIADWARNQMTYIMGDIPWGGHILWDTVMITHGTPTTGRPTDPQQTACLIPRSTAIFYGVPW